MRIVCPNCAAAYDVPDQVLAGPPRLFRCARCAHEWTPAFVPLPLPAPDVPMAPPKPMPVKPAAIGLPPDYPAPAQGSMLAMSPSLPPSPADWQPPLAIGAPLVDDDRIARAPGAGNVVGIVGWALTVAILALAIVLAVLRQPQIEALWPASQRLYALLGLH